MAKDTGDRVSELLKTLKLDEAEASRRIKKSTATLNRIINKVHSPSKTTLQLIADEFNCSYNWLVTGEGEMFSEAPAKGRPTVDPWKDALVSQIKEENNRLTNELNRVWAMVNHLSGGKIANFRKLTNEAGTPFYTITGNGLGVSLVGKG